MRFLFVIALLLSLLQTSSAMGSGHPVAITDLTQLRDIGGHSRGSINVSPDGRWVVFQLQTPRLSKNDYELTWMALSTDGGEAISIADGGDLLLNPTMHTTTNGDRPQVRVKWSPDSKYFVYLLRTEGRTQLWRSRPDRTGRVQVTFNAADVTEYVWSRDGKKIYFTTARDTVQVESGLVEEGERGFLYDDRFFPMISNRPVQQNCTDDYSYAGSIGLAGSCDPPIWVYELQSHDERLATAEERDVFLELQGGLNAPEEIKARKIRQLRKSGNGHRYVWYENIDPETYRGAYAPLNIFAYADNRIIECASDLCTANAYRGHEDLWWREDGQEVIFLRRIGRSLNQQGLFGWSPTTGVIRTIRKHDAWISDCAPASERLICLVEGGTQPRKIASVSLVDGSISTLFDPNPEFARHAFSKIEKLEWEDAYGNATYGHLAYPIGFERGRIYPLVIVTYRSQGFLRGGVGDEYPIHPLAAEGFFVLSHDMPFDLEIGAKEADLNAGLYENLYRRKSVLSAQKLIVEQLAETGLIDKSRVAITGLSEGAAQATYAISHSDIFAAAIVSGAWDSPSSYYLMNGTARRWWRELSNGAPDDPESTVHELSVGLNAARVEAPLLVNVSDEEFLGSVENVERLKETGNPVEMYVFPGEYHIKWRPDHRLAIYRRNIQWLKFWLKGEEEEDPVSPGQYERWREMRDRQCAEDWSEREKPSYCEYAGAVH